MTIGDWISLGLTIASVYFFTAGTVGLLRFPDIYTRLHALTKADNLGLGLLVLALSVRAESWLTVVKLMLIWLLALVTSSTLSHVIARSALQRGILPWRQPS